MAVTKIRNFFTDVVCAVWAFVRSNAINVRDGKIWNLGQNGDYWSRVAQSTTNAYNLNMNPTAVNPSNNNNRWNGFPLRWVCPLRCRSFVIIDFYTYVCYNHSRGDAFR